MIFVTSYNRPQKLLRLLKELRPDLMEGKNGNVIDIRNKDSAPPNKIVVIDDGSNYNPAEHLNYCQYYRTPHRGKAGFWKQWQLMFDIAEESTDREFIFLQDDLYNVDLEGLRQVDTPELYALNVMDVGPDRGWSPVGYVDCIFKTNRKTLEAINWFMPPVDPSRWMRRPHLSSGVGQNLSQLFYRKNIPMILPEQNYASHGDAESKMHPSERLKNPLKAKTGE